MAKKTKNDPSSAGEQPLKDKDQKAGKEPLPGDPEYPESEDIYSRDLKEDSIEPDGELTPAKKTAKDRSPGDDLDIPGSELDDQDEEIGEEDEENNYYSLGGDDHDDLEEDRGD